jgi:hypothetical protein
MMMRSIFEKPGFRETAVLFMLLVPLCLLASGAAIAQEKPWALGIGLEGNMNTFRSVSGASWLSATIDLGGYFAAGIKTGYSHNFADSGTLEMAALGRWYFLAVKESRLFAQAELGADLIFYDQKTIPSLLGGLALGWNIPLGPVYLEPALRGGYPYIWGAGLSFGWRM